MVPWSSTLTPSGRSAVIGASSSVGFLRPKADDEVHSCCGGPRFTDGGDRGGELPAFLRVGKIELQVGMRGGSKSEDAGLGRVHEVIISGAVARARRVGPSGNTHSPTLMMAEKAAGWLRGAGGG